MFLLVSNSIRVHDVYRQETTSLGAPRQNSLRLRHRRIVGREPIARDIEQQESTKRPYTCTVPSEVVYLAVPAAAHKLDFNEQPTSKGVLDSSGALFSI